jgi:AsmA-like protein
MTEEVERGRRKRYRLVLALVVVVVLLAIFIVPPLVSIGGYKNRIARVISTSLGRSVRLSSVELRLLPRPEFVITDLTVEEDPAFGAEPVLHANTVVAAVRLLSLWRGRLEVSGLSVDEASLNLVRDSAGRWNLDPFFRAATARKADTAQIAAPPLPYLEATNSRINLKRGIEKLPYSLVNADIAFWQESGGDWRVRLRGQPARTDVSLDLADTGILRLEAHLHRAPDLNKMPIHLDLDWREAQLGQLSRLIVGSDPGWRGDLTGDMQLDGTAESAQVKARLTASGVHRAEFAPAEALDFDANCNFVYRYLGKAVEKLSCDSPLGDGRVTLAGDLPANAPPKLSVEMQRIPVSVGIGMLRTLRSGFNSGLEVSGAISGKVAYDAGVAGADDGKSATRHSRTLKKHGKNPSADEPRGPLTGSFSVDNLKLSGGGLGQPLLIPKTTVQPAAVAPGNAQALTATLFVPAGGPTPVSVAIQFTTAGYQASVHGPASLTRIRELAHLAGIGNVAALDGMAGDPATLDLNTEGPWVSMPQAPADAPVGIAVSLDNALVLKNADSDQLTGIITVHNANWKSGALANHVEIAQAVLHLGGKATVWDPIQFSDGPVKGTASLQSASDCAAGQECLPQLDLHFDELDAAELQAALLGAQQKSTGLSALIERFSASAAPAWPRINATVEADSLKLGPVTLDDAEISLRLLPTGAEFTSIEGNLLGGKVHATGKLTQGDKPAYEFEGSFEKLNGPATCELLSLHCLGGSLEGKGKLELSGFTDSELAASAKGTLHFEWRHGAIEESAATEIPKEVAHFDRWTADAAIANNAAALAASEVQQGTHKSSVSATLTFADPPVVSFAEPKSIRSAKR